MFVHVATQIPPSLDHRKFAQFLSLFPSLEKKYICIHIHRERNKSHLTNMTHLSPQSAEIAEIKIGHRRFVQSKFRPRNSIKVLRFLGRFSMTIQIKKKKIKEIVHNNISMSNLARKIRKIRIDLSSKETSIPMIKSKRNLIRGT